MLLFHISQLYGFFSFINSMKAKNIVTHPPLYPMTPSLSRDPFSHQFLGFVSLSQAFFYFFNVSFPGLFSCDPVLFHIYWYLPIEQKLFFFFFFPAHQNVKLNIFEQFGLFWFCSLKVFQFTSLFINHVSIV